MFTDPQIASVGLTENEAVAKGFDVSCKVQNYADVAYGWAMEDTTGIVQTRRRLHDRPAARCAHHGTPGLVDHPAADSGDVFGLNMHEMARGQYWIHPALPEVVENALLGLSD